MRGISTSLLDPIPGERPASRIARAAKLVQRRWLLLIVASGVALCGSFLSGAAQNLKSPAEKPSGEAPAYEVAAIKVHPPGYWPTSETRRFTAEGVVWDNIHIQNVIVRAFDLRDPTFTYSARLIPGGPKWIESDWYDIEAKMSDQDSSEYARLSPDEQEAMTRRTLQALLVDRFGLKYHRMTEMAPAYVIVPGKNGPRNMKKEPDNAKLSIAWSDMGHGEYHAAPFSLVVGLLESIDRIPVVDKSGLTGKYDFTLEFSRDAGMVRPDAGSVPASNDSRPPLRFALEEELGLKVERTKAPLESIVIDHIERPSPN